MFLKDNEFEIRPIKEDEIDKVLNVYQECEDFLELGPVPKASISMVKTDIKNSKDEKGIYWGIFNLNDEMIGIVDFIPDNYLNNADQAFLALLMIAKPFRNKGIGTKIVKLVELEIMKNKEIKYIYSGVQVNNEFAINFWNKMGYIICAGPIFLEDQTTVFHLVKKI